MTSCATIILGTKQKVAFTSNVDSTTFIIDDSIQLRSGRDIKLHRRRLHTVRIDEHGYDRVSLEIRRSIHPAIALNFIAWPPMLFSLMAYGIVTDENGENFGWTAASFYGGLFSPWIASSLDVLLGGGLKIPKSIHVDLYKTPQHLNGRNIWVNEAEVKVRGELIGLNGRTMYYLQPGAGTMSNNEKGVNLLNYEVSRQVSEVLTRYGCTSNSMDDKLESEKQPSLELKPVVEDVDLKVDKMGNSYETKATLKMLWLLTDAKETEQSWTFNTTASGTVISESGPQAIMIALDHNAYHLLSDSEFRAIVER